MDSPNCVGRLNRTELAECKSHHGWDAAVNLITPLKRQWWSRRWRWARMKLFLSSDWRMRWLNEAKLLNTMPVDAQLRRLNHLHYARWSIVHRLPRFRGTQQPRETGKYTLMLFTSYFDFGWRRYLGTFIETTGNGLAELWDGTPTWVDPKKGYREFENFVIDQHVDHAHLFSAHPTWSCNDVRSMIRLYQDFWADSRGAEAMSPNGETVRHEPRKLANGLLRRVQHCVGPVKPLPPEYQGIAAHRGLIPERSAGPNPDQKRYEVIGDRLYDSVVTGHETHGATFLIPIPKGNAARLGEVLAPSRLGFGPESPFAKVPGTHFGRLMLLGDEYFKNGEGQLRYLKIDKKGRRREVVEPFRSDYLMLSGEIDYATGWWLERLFEENQELFTEVMGLSWKPVRSASDFASSLIADCEIKPTLEFIDYPNTTVAEIMQAARGFERSRTAVVN